MTRTLSIEVILLIVLAVVTTVGCIPMGMCAREDDELPPPKVEEVSIEKEERQG